MVRVSLPINGNVRQTVVVAHGQILAQTVKIIIPVIWVQLVVITTNALLHKVDLDVMSSHQTVWNWRFFPMQLLLRNPLKQLFAREQPGQ